MVCSVLFICLFLLRTSKNNWFFFSQLSSRIYLKFIGKICSTLYLLMRRNPCSLKKVREFYINYSWHFLSSHAPFKRFETIIIFCFFYLFVCLFVLFVCLLRKLRKILLLIFVLIFFNL